MRGHHFLLVIVDYVTRYPDAIPLQGMQVSGMARALVQMFSRVGIPKEILTDQGTSFTSNLMQQLCRLLQIKQIFTTNYHPQTDGLVERMNQTIKGLLRKALDAFPRQWDHLIDPLLFTLQEAPQFSTGFPPFDLVYGWKPRSLLWCLQEGWAPTDPSPARSATEYLE